MSDKVIKQMKKRTPNKDLTIFERDKKQGRIHGNPVADGWAGAVM